MIKKSGLYLERGILYKALSVLGALWSGMFLLQCNLVLFGHKVEGLRAGEMGLQDKNRG